MRKGESFKKDRWRVVAYNKAIRALKDYDGKFTKSDDVKHLHGIGVKILAKIDEIIDTGKLKAANKIRVDKVISAIDVIGKVATIGPVKAKELVEKHNIKTIDELRKNQHLLNEKQKIGLKYYEDLQLRIPRQEIDKHNIFLQKVVKELDPKITLSIVGSYRRKVKTSGDIDILLRHTDNKNIFKLVVDKLINIGYLKDTLSYGNKKYGGIGRLDNNKNRRIDILFTTKKEYPFALLYFTGSGVFNTVIRKKAGDLGYKLNEYGMKKGDEYITGVKDEKDIFKILKIKYLDPENRYPNNIVNL